MLSISFVWQLTSAWIEDRRRRIGLDPEDHDHDRGAGFLEYAIIAALIAAGAIVVVGIIVARAVGRANEIETQ